MAGLSLNVGAYGGSMSQGALPNAAMTPEAPRTIGQQAFGVWSQQSQAGPATAAIGTVALGIAGLIVLGWLWYSLPR
jgi:hypothetical protein